MRATVKDVAVHAGVSPKTVSNVITGTAFVAPDTRARVEAALTELDYVPNLSARGLRNGRTGLIALALPDLDTAFSAEMIHHVVEEAHERGWAVQVEQTKASRERERELLSRARAHMIDGLILNPVTLGASSVLDEPTLPPVVLMGEVEQSRVDQVLTDTRAAAQEMTELLIARGCRRIAIVGSTSVAETATARLRTEGYRQALASAGLPHDPCLELGLDDWTAEGGAAVVGAFVDDGSTADAFFCFTDGVALGALSALADRGIRVPDDVLLAGIDDVRAGRFGVPPLTTIAWDKRLVARTALDQLSARIDHRAAPAERIVLPYTVIERASTRRRPLDRV